MRPATVTVIIPTCDRAHFLGETLDSVLGRTVPPTQVIVVNDGSTDSTPAVLGRYGTRIEVIDQENCGRARAVNHAMARVSGEYLWILDDDDLASLRACGAGFPAMSRQTPRGGRRLLR